MKCVFCPQTDCIAVANSQGAHWMYCPECKASGPHRESESDARIAWKPGSAQSAGGGQGLFARLGLRRGTETEAH